jgi:acyl-CoA synthetase (NDP forming)
MSNVQPLASLFSPKSVALIGVTEKSPFSVLTVRMLEAYQYPGPVHLVNKRGGTVFGRPAVTSMREIGEKVDLAYVMVPFAAVLPTLEEVASAGVRNVIVLTSGFAEVGDEGRRAQGQLVAAARKHRLNLLGPNSLGFHYIRGRTAVSPIPVNMPLLEGDLAIVTQSGASASDLYQFAYQENIGLSYLVHTGNEAVIDLSDVIDYLVEDPGTRSIAIFAETVRQPELFIRTARRAAEVGKPIVMLKIGASELSARVAAAHTGSLVGDDRVFDAVCRKLGVVRVRSIEDLIYTAGLLGRIKPMHKPGIGIVSISGGACTLVADQSERVGLPLPAFAEQTQRELRALLPPYASTLNPLDVTGGVLSTPEVFEKLIHCVSQDPNVGLTGVIFDVPNSRDYVSPVLPVIGRALADPQVNGLLLTVTVKALNDTSRKVLKDMNDPFVLAGVDHAARALACAAWWSQRTRELKEELAQPRSAEVAETGARPESELETLSYLAGRGIPVISQSLAHSREQAVEVAARLGGPVVLKIASRDIPHKTEAGGVKLALEGPEAVGSAYDAILSSVRRYKPAARIDGVLVSPMRRGQLELYVGTMRDPAWGPVILAGLGGIWVEILKDTGLRLLPVRHDEAIDMLKGLRASSLLHGYRGMPGVDLDAAAQMIVKIGEAALALGAQLESLEINPLAANGAALEALDALAIWKEGA